MSERTQKILAATLGIVVAAIVHHTAFADTTIHGITIRTAEDGNASSLRVCWPTGQDATSRLATYTWNHQRPYFGTGAVVVWCFETPERRKPSGVTEVSSTSAPEATPALAPISTGPPDDGTEWVDETPFVPEGPKEAEHPLAAPTVPK